MKKIIYYLGILFLAIIIILNLLLTANLDVVEHIDINFNSFIYTLGLIFVGLFLFFITKIINHYFENKKQDLKIKNIRNILFIIVIVCYTIFQILWLLFVNPPIVGDQVHACNLAQTFYRGNLEEFLPDLTYANIPLSEYMQAYHQQISLAFVFSIIFRLIHFDAYGVLRVVNAISVLFIVFALYKILKHLSKEYKVNFVLLFTLILTFVSIPMLSNFIYGDMPSLALCLFAIYFMMNYTKTNKIHYPILATLFTMIAYMMRMNCLIFIIATAIYLILNLLKNLHFGRTMFESTNIKETALKIAIIIVYICISILPASFVKHYYLNKYELDKTKSYPNISYFLMAMEESRRGNGWYNEERGEYALNNPIKAKEEYKNLIKERLSYFSQNLDYTFSFYINKIASMWTENTYSSIRNNTSIENDPLEKAIEPLTFYQKSLLILTCCCCLIVLLQNRKKLSLDILFLITIFIGGFAFHILWEAKSRYIIPYIVVLIPVAAIEIENFNLWKKIKK